MGYIRDDKTGKFTWVDGVLDDDATYESASSELPGGSTQAGGASVPRAWLMWGGVVALVAGFGVWATMRPHGQSESIANIRAQAASMDGRDVELRGRAGQVFDVGAGSAYYLHQGRDSIVVYTHGPRPLEHQNVTVRGSISIGYLDGAARPALFEKN